MPTEAIDAGSQPPSDDGVTTLPEGPILIALGLGFSVFLYLTATGVESLGIGALVPAVISQMVAATILLVGLATAVVNASLGGNLAGSVAPVLAIALGFALFLVVDAAFGLDGVVADLPVHVVALAWILVSILAGIGLHLLGAGLGWVAENVPLRT